MSQDQGVIAPETHQSKAETHQLTTPVNQVPATHESGNFLTILNNPEALQSLDIDKIERLLAAQKDWEDQKMTREMTLESRAARKAFSKAFAQMQKDIPTIEKALYNDQTRSKYADLGMISKRINPHVAKYGFSLYFDPSQTKEDVTVVCVLLHEDGHEKHTPITYPLDSAGVKGTVNKTVIHATKSAMSYAARTAVCLALNIPLVDDDGNAAGGIETLQGREEFCEALNSRLMRASERTRDWFRETFGSVPAVPLHEFSMVRQMLDKAIADAAKASEAATQEDTATTDTVQGELIND